MKKKMSSTLFFLRMRRQKWDDGHHSTLAVNKSPCKMYFTKNILTKMCFIFIHKESIQCSLCLLSQRALIEAHSGSKSVMRPGAERQTDGNIWWLVPSEFSPQGIPGAQSLTLLSGEANWPIEWAEFCWTFDWRYFYFGSNLHSPFPLIYLFLLTCITLLMSIC